MGYSLETGTPLIRYVLKAFAYKIGMRKYDIELLEAFASAGFDFSYKAFKLLDYDNYLGQWVDQEARGNALDYFLHHQHRYHHYGIFTETLIDWNDKTAQWANEKAQTEEKQWALNRYLEIIDQADKNMLNLFENNEKTNPAPGFYEVKDFVSYKINDLSDGSHYIKAKRLFREYF